jgi:alpha-L-fucosidase
MRIRLAVVFVSLLGIAVRADNSTSADLAKSKGDTRQADSREYVRRTDPAMLHWKQDRFGVMIHFGLYAVPGGVWQGKEIKGAAEWIKAFAKIPNKDYESLISQFNPVQYDPVAWAKAFKQAGAKYAVITTKHHDGFCLFDSKFTDYDIAGTPYKKDMLRPFADAMRAQGIDVGVYYSIIDWHHPDYRAVLRTDDDKAAYARYIVYLKNQVKEILTNYGPMTTIWFDGRWDQSYRSNPEIGKEIEAYCRSLSPGIVIGDRVRAYDSIADYDSGYERKLPTTQPANDWESCVTMTENSWGYHQSWSGAGWKTPKMLCEWGARCAAMDGNFLINVGPKPDGTIREEELSRLQRVGDWMKINGQAIYGSTPFPIADLPPEVYATRKDGTVYLLVFRWPDTNKIKLKGLRISSATRLTTEGGEPVKLEGDDTLTGLPVDPPDSIATVFALQPAGEPTTKP